MREWFTASEILDARSAALPTTVQALNRYAERLGWRDDTRRCRSDGAGFAYHLSLLPADVQARLVATQAPVQTGVDPRSAGLWQRFERLPDAKKAEARARLAAVDRVAVLARGGMARRAAVALTAGEAKVSSSTLWNWLRLADSVAVSDRLAALAPKHAGRTATTACDPRAWDFLIADYLRPEQPSFEACYRRLVEAAAEHQWSPLPSAKTLKRRIEKTIPRAARTLARAGRDAAERIYPHQTRDRAVFHAMQACNADTHTFDVFVRWDDGAIGRPAMVAVQDLYSGLVLAHRVTATENWTVVRHAFADVLESFGIPDEAWFDNGRAFASKWMTGGAKTRYRFTVRDDEPAGLLTQLGVKVHWTTPYHGQAKPIERAFRDLCEEIAKHPRCAGAYTGNSPVAKPENYGSRAVPIAEFRALVAAEIARHNLRPGRRSAVAAGRSFSATFRASLDQPTTLIRRAGPEQRRMFLLAAEGIVARKPTGELQLGGNRYWAEALVAHMGEKLVARFDPDDLFAGIAVYARDGRFLCEAPCIAAEGFNDMDAAREHARARRSWFKAQRELLDIERRLSIGAVAKLLPAPEPVAEPPRPKVVRLVANGIAREDGRERPYADDDRIWAGAGSFSRAARLLEEHGELIPFSSSSHPKETDA
ncbi:MAG: DDE-type integrase/transposase/recombinase [Rhizobiales bacterium]|nr:DDE-type integrase/transposase/recombinase [Hyphomicrobiales bacterium]